MIRAITTVGWIGTIPFAPGTWGSLAGVALTWGLHRLGHAPLVVLATLAVSALGIWAIARDPRTANDDPGEIVIDEVAGQMLALWPLSIALWMQNHPAEVFPLPGLVGGFLLFRFFDIVKPPPVRWVDRPGAFWIMADDLVAGALAGLVMLIAAGVSHGWFF